MSLDGILCVDKPSGWTSHDVVAKVRGLTGQRKAGHTGTLDPAATGVLVVCLGKATRLVEYMVGHRKEYRGVVALGTRTSTDDAEGEVLEERPVPAIPDGRLRALEREFSGEIEQRPPAVSAVKVEGQRAYQLARRGQPVELRARRVSVYRLEISVLEEGRLAIEVECGAGTYVRSLARDIGAALGCGGHLGQLRRTRVGRLREGDALTLEEVARLAEEGTLESVLWPADEGALELDAAIVSQEKAARLAAGLRVDAALERPTEAARIYDMGGGFVGIGAADSGQIRPKKVFL